MQKNLNNSFEIYQSEYEREFSSFLGKDLFAFSFWKGRVALYALLKAMGVKEGDEVILPGYTCVVVPNAIRLCGAKPVYVDINTDGFNINSDLIEDAITSKTKVIIVQHTYGIAGPIDEVLGIAKKRSLFVVEDAAHALGSTHNGKMLGTYGDASFFSSQWSKPYTTGLGGVAVTRDPVLAEKIAVIKSSFSEPPLVPKMKLNFQYSFFNWFYSPKRFWFAQRLLRYLSKTGLFVGSSSVEELDGKLPQDHTWKMSKSQENAGLKKLKNFAQIIQKKQLLGHFYEIGVPKQFLRNVNQNKEETIWLRYPVQISNKLALLKKAQENQIELGTWFESPLHPISLEKHHLFEYTLGQCPNAEEASSRTVNLPINEKMTVADANKVLSFFLEYADV